jgi:acetyl-CoA carboxylase carboxyltransferase component
LAQIPVLSDFLIINRKTGFLWMGGEIESDDAGSADFHMEKSGQCDLVADSDEEAIDFAKQILAYIPQRPSIWPNRSWPTSRKIAGRNPRPLNPQTILREEKKPCWM